MAAGRDREGSLRPGRRSGDSAARGDAVDVHPQVVVARLGRHPPPEAEAARDGEEGEPGLEKLIHLQEPDGSWSPNAFYKQDALYFGSRELTTVWCMLALFLSACWNRPTARTPVAPAGGTARGPAVSLHERVPPHLRCEAQDQFRRLEGLLPLSADWDVFLGTWQDMPPHFLVPEPGRLLIGINLTRPVATPFHSTAFRPLKTEITLALFTAERVRLRGPLRDRLERMYVLGLALWVCGLLAPELPFHRQAGMSPLDERWCTEHEPYLWSRVREFLIRPDPAQGPFSLASPGRWTAQARSDSGRDASVPGQEAFRRRAVQRLSGQAGDTRPAPRGPRRDPSSVPHQGRCDSKDTFSFPEVFP